MAAISSEVLASEKGPKKLWDSILENIQRQVRPEQFETWFRRTSLHSIDKDRLVIAVPNDFYRDWLRKYYREILEKAAISLGGKPYRIDFHVDPELNVGRAAEAEKKSALKTVENAGPAKKLHSASDFVLNDAYTFENFVVGPDNRFPHAASLGVVESPGKQFNPLFLHGAVGLGKTHLLQAICHTLLERHPEMKILYISCETFVNHFISALANGALESFRFRYRGVDMLLIDDVHLLANKDKSQEEFFHTFNALHQARKQIVLSSDCPPKEISSLQERLVSRFQWGLVAPIEPPSYETRVAILKKKAQLRGLDLPDDVAKFLAEKITSNVRELEGAVTKILGYASLTHRLVDMALVRETMRESLNLRGRMITIEDVLALVTARFNMKLSDLQSKKRSQSIALPRQVGMYLCRQYTRHSLEEIGGYFGGRDHTTVLYAVGKIKTEIEKDSKIREVIAELCSQLQRANQT